MNLNTSWTELSGALKNMRLHWEAVEPVWNDPVRKEFVEKHWDPLEEQVLATLRALDRLGPLLAQLHNDCR